MRTQIGDAAVTALVHPYRSVEPSDERAGSMVLRAWLESGRPDRLRVRVFSTIGSQRASPLVVSSVGAVHAAVQDWLDDLQSSPDDPGAPG